jgi:hypothetical protein
MKYRILSLLLATAIVASLSGIGYSLSKESLTPDEILQVQENKALDIRVKLYMDAAGRRIAAAQQRLAGKEPEEGEPFELYSPEDFIDSYCQILKTVMNNLDEVYKKPRTRENLGKALKNLKNGTERNGKELAILKRYAEDQKNEELWKAVNHAIEMNDDAHNGAEYGLSHQTSPDEKEKSRQ